MSELIQIVTTIDDEEQAHRIGRQLVNDHLAACVQVLGPMTSIYRWEGQVETSREWMCVAKTTQARYAEVEQAIKRLHSYDLPEIVAVPLVAGSSAYLDWLRAEVTTKGPARTDRADAENRK